MNASGVPGGDGQTAASGPPAPSLGQLKEALRVLEQTQHLFNNMKAKVVYACGEGHLLAADDGRQYLARVIKSLDDEHRMIRTGWPRLAAALEVARTVNKAAVARGHSASSGGVGPAAALQGRGPGAAVEATAATSVQGHCRSVVQQLEAVLCEDLLAAGGTDLPRRAKRPRTDGDSRSPPPPPTQGAHPTSTSPPAAASTAPTAPEGAPRASPPGHSAAPTSAASPSFLSPSAPAATACPMELLGVLLRMRALEGVGGPGGGGGSGGASGGGVLGGMRLHPLDDGGNPLSLPSALTAALSASAASAASAAAAAGAGGAASAGGLGSGREVSGLGLGSALLPQVDDVLLAAGAARLVSATQVRMLLPGVFAVNVLLEGPGRAAPLRVAVDSADKAFELDPWATPTTQVFRRLSALATRVLTYYIKRAPLSLQPPPAAAAFPAPQLSEPNSPGAAALEDLLLWLLGCRDLFSKRCAATGKLMAWDPSVQYPVPPIFRTFKLPREELRLRAVDLSRVAAYHMHVAPVEQLGWEEDVPGAALAAERTAAGNVAAGGVAAVALPTSAAV